MLKFTFIKVKLMLECKFKNGGRNINNPQYSDNRKCKRSARLSNKRPRAQ